ncbi:MAG: thioredoxin-disulfide reductase [Candidatus Nitrosotenuis sp.]
MMASDSGSTVLMEKEFPKTEKKKTKYDVIIIGAGPAGYTAGIYCSRARHDTLILSGILPGGQLVNTTEVENYPGFENGIMGPDLMLIMRKQTERMGTTIIDDEVVDVDFRHKPFKILTASEEYECKAVIIATGASPRKIGLQSEQTFGGRGVSYCATCDGPFFRNQEIVVVGGGDSAIEEATFLTKFASKVHLVHRRDALRASKVMQERALSNSKIQMHWNSVVSDIQGNQKVQTVVLSDTKSGQTSALQVGAVFVAIGHEPNTKIFVNQVELDEQGYIKLKDHTKTSVEGVFAAGDVHDHRYRQAITAAGYGCQAAIDVDKYLTETKS